jgi:hypothetical protein
MKLYYMYDSMVVDMKNMFVDNIKDPFELIKIEINTPEFNENTDHTLKFGGGIDVWKSRVNNILNIIKESPNNEHFIFSDIDIIFYKPVMPKLYELIENKDVLFLRELFEGIHEWQGGNINFGFNIIRANKKTYNFFDKVRVELERTNGWEQMIINKFLYSPNDFNLNWDLLPPTFLSTSVGLHNITKDILMYHANCAVTKESKYNLINQVNEIVQKTCA